MERGHEMKILRIPWRRVVATMLLAGSLLALLGLATGSPAHAAKKKKKPLAKNIIIMISDGWGFNHLEAASYWEYGKDARQIYNWFPLIF